MSVEASIVTALASVAGGRVFPAAAPEEEPNPLVVYRRTHYTPVMTLAGYANQSYSEFIFECWGAKSDVTTAKQSALDTAASVVSALEAAAGLTNKFRLPLSDEESFDPSTLEQMEPVKYGFWHT